MFSPYFLGIIIKRINLILIIIFSIFSCTGSREKITVRNDRPKTEIKIYKSVEIIYGLRNFIGNANKFSKNKIDIYLNSDETTTNIVIRYENL